MLRSSMTNSTIISAASPTPRNSSRRMWIESGGDLRDHITVAPAGFHQVGDTGPGQFRAQRADQHLDHLVRSVAARIVQMLEQGRARKHAAALRAQRFEQRVFLRGEY